MRHTTTSEKVRLYEAVHPAFAALFSEIQDLAKKKPDLTMNKLKVALVNRVLTQVKNVLGSEDSAQFLDLLDEDLLPQLSDALLIMSQYRGGLDHFKARYYSHELGTGWGWRTG